MKKIFITAAAVVITTFYACQNGAKDNKNQVEAYPTTDTTAKMEHLNNGSADSSGSNAQSNSGDIH